MADILSMGELLIDFIEQKDKNSDDIYYKRTAGGESANVACMCAKLGASSGLITKIGGDMFGKFLKKTAEDFGVDSSGIIIDKNFRTSLAFVTSEKNGKKDFVFYRKNTADSNISFNDVDLRLIDKCKIFHFGGLSLIKEPSKSAVLNSAEYAKAKDKIISFAPNYRQGLWDSTESAAKSMQYAATYADILTVTEDELTLLAGCGNLLPAVSKLLHEGIKIICVTGGAKGCIIATNSSVSLYPSYKIDEVDSTGASGAFLGGFLFKILEKAKDISELSSDEILEIALFANACGALSSLGSGAMSALPSFDEVIKFIDEHKGDLNYV